MEVLDLKKLSAETKLLREKLFSVTAVRPVDKIGGAHAQSEQIQPNEFGQLLGFFGNFSASDSALSRVSRR